jgi:hypothetical protein
MLLGGGIVESAPGASVFRGGGGAVFVLGGSLRNSMGGGGAVIVLGGP